MEKPQVIQIAMFKPEELATYSDLNGMYSRGKEARKIPLDKIYVRAGFNHRLDFGDIESLAEYILTGGEVPPIVVDVLKDGTAVLMEGERRVRAYKLLVSRGYEKFNVIQAFINPRNLTEQERVIKSLASNNGKSWEPMELAEGFQDLREVYGMSNSDIAKATGYSQMHVSNMMRLAGITDEEKDLIRTGAVSATAVLDLTKKNIGPGARLDAIKEAGGRGEKVKVKDVEVMGDLKAKTLEDTDTPESLIKGLLIHVKALDRIIGTDSRMSDITFKIDAELRVLKTLIATKYISISNGNQVSLLSPATKIEEAFDINSPWVPGLSTIDPLFKEAAEIIFNDRIATGSILQRKLKIGFNRADRILTQLEHYKIIGAFEGSQPRMILIHDLQSLLARIELTKNLNEDEPTF